MAYLEKKDVLFEAIKRASLQNIKYKNVRRDGSFEPTVVHNLFVKPNKDELFFGRLSRMLTYTSCYHNGQSDLFQEFNALLDKWGLSETVKDSYICNMFYLKQLQLNTCEPVGDYKYVSIRGKIHLKGLCSVGGWYTIYDPTPFGGYDIDSKVEDMLLENKGYPPVNKPNAPYGVAPQPNYPSNLEISNFVNSFIGKKFSFDAEMDILIDISQHQKLQEDYQRFLKKEGYYGLK